MSGAAISGLSSLLFYFIIDLILKFYEFINNSLAWLAGFGLYFLFLVPRTMDFWVDARSAQQVP